MDSRAKTVHIKLEIEYMKETTFLIKVMKGDSIRKVYIATVGLTPTMDR